MMVLLLMIAPAFAQLPSGQPDAPSFADHDISIDNFQFVDGSITVQVGDTVRWVNDDSATHTVTAGDGSFDSGDLQNGDDFEFTFDTLGSFPYKCNLHPAMTGTITVVNGEVEEPAPTPEPEPTTTTTEPEPTPSPTTTPSPTPTPSAPTPSPTPKPSTTKPSPVPSAPTPTSAPLPSAPTSAPPQVQQPAPTPSGDMREIKNDMSQLGATLTDIAERVENTERKIDTVKSQTERLESQITIVTADEPTAFTMPLMVLFGLFILLVLHVVYLTFRHQHVAEHVANIKKHLGPQTKEGKLDSYISGCLRQGMRKDQIKQYLEAHGWDKTTVETAFSKYKG